MVGYYIFQLTSATSRSLSNVGKRDIYSVYFVPIPRYSVFELSSVFKDVIFFSLFVPLIKTHRLGFDHRLGF